MPANESDKCECVPSLFVIKRHLSFCHLTFNTKQGLNPRQIIDGILILFELLVFSNVVQTPTGGSFQSPGFPEPYPAAATFTWKVSVAHVDRLNGQELFPNCKVIDLTFDTMETGLDQAQDNGNTPRVVDCSSDAMRTVVDVYRGDTKDESKLEMRYVAKRSSVFVFV